ncbi:MULTISPECIES: bacteriocin-like protein [Chryseobacterium]|uniref:Bacteriocin-type signal sequence-containing protein n=1 Tax=Chryseobacterium gambrini TaxID=373672 RepID=A0A1N7QHU4_9FLAO|nr:MULTISPECIES: hypothetical protein [Chryseobacterium]WBV51840.1 hypothetical protein PFY09_16060 [Chryseobacterium gambrini]WBX95903.1 hypothetical protein PE065_13575 [Chryseobacterium gambrini]SIT22087.1 hypothetical protein SAMN05421785_111140 [Chryseobacterium gambrini]
MKNLKKLNRNQLKTVTGGIACRTEDDYCPGTSVCCRNGGQFDGLCRSLQQMATQCAF